MKITRKYDIQYFIIKKILKIVTRVGADLVNAIQKKNNNQ